MLFSPGVSQLVVAVNKLDTVDWSETRFTEIVTKLKAFLKTVGFREADVTYVPCSGYTGDNLAKRSGKMPWRVEKSVPLFLENASFIYLFLYLRYDASGPSLLEAIDRFRVPERLVEKPFRLSISDIYKAQTGFSCSGRIEAGFVQKDDKVLILPLNQVKTTLSD